MIGTTLLPDELDILLAVDSCLNAMLKQMSQDVVVGMRGAFRSPYVQSPYRPEVATFHIGTISCLATP